MCACIYIYIYIYTDVGETPQARGILRVPYIDLSLSYTPHARKATPSSGKVS